MKLPVKYTAAAMLASIITFACNKNDDPALPEAPVQISLTSDEVNLIRSENTFAFELLRNVLADEDASGNVIISPLSVSYALSMTVNGANGATRDSILKAMAASGMTPGAINNSYKTLTEALLSVDQRVIMQIANSVWTENDFAVKKEFIDILTRYYKSQSEAFDINDPSTPDKMNLWIENNTNGLIKEMIEELDDNTVMLLINAIYFKGKWESQFDPKKTVQELFFKKDGTSITVPMMKQEANYKIFQGNGFVMAELPYGQGNFVMDVILPDGQNGMDALISNINENTFSSWTGLLNERKTNISFPRFKYKYKLSLKNSLSGMGMGLAFTDQADFTNISQAANLLINDVSHQAFIETNEEGTEAAAATTVEIGITSIQEPFQLKLDRPFLYVIREITTNSILFMGRISDPMAS